MLRKRPKDLRLDARNDPPGSIGRMGALGSCGRPVAFHSYCLMRQVSTVPPQFRRRKSGLGLETLLTPDASVE